VKYVFKKSSLRNCVNKLPRKTHTDSAVENCSRKSYLTMWALCNLLTRRYLPTTHIITDSTQLLQQTKKTLQQNPFAHHQCSVKVSDDVSWQDKTGLHQFDNYRSQVKINATTVNNSCFLRYPRYLASSSSFSRTVLCTEHVRQSAFLPVT